MKRQWAVACFVGLIAAGWGCGSSKKTASPPPPPPAYSNPGHQPTKIQSVTVLADETACAYGGASMGVTLQVGTNFGLIDQNFTAACNGPFNVRGGAGDVHCTLMSNMCYLAPYHGSEISAACNSQGTPASVTDVNSFACACDPCTDSLCPGYPGGAYCRNLCATSSVCDPNCPAYDFCLCYPNDSECVAPVCPDVCNPNCLDYDLCTCNAYAPGCSPPPAPACPDVCNPDCSDYDFCSCNPSDPSCQPVSCNVCDPTCSNYDPNDPSCSPCPDVCNETCSNYDLCTCTPNDPSCQSCDPCTDSSCPGSCSSNTSSIQRLIRKPQ